MYLKYWIFSAIATPPLVLIHELGHAAVALVRTKNVVHLRVGRDPAWFSGRVGRLSFAVSFFPGRFVGGYAQSFARGVGPFDRFLICVAGPLASGAAAVLLWDGQSRVHGHLHSFVLATAAVATLHALLNLLPLETRRKQPLMTDGRQAARALRDLRAKRTMNHAALDGSDLTSFIRTFDETYNRWLPLASKEGSPTRDPRRRHALRSAAVWLGFAPESNQATAIEAMAAGGWWWREVEGAGSEDLSVAVRDAIKVAAQTGAVPPALQVHAAAQLVSASAPLELACPCDEGERVAFLARAVTKCFAIPDELGISKEQRRIAFSFGIAFREVEEFEPLATPRLG